MLSSLKITLRSRRMLWLMYGISLVLGLLVTLPLYATLKTLDDNSLAFMNLLPGFDYTVYKDFMQVNSKAISPLLSVGRWLGILYLFLSVFFTGGILFQFAQSTVPLRAEAFWQACSHYISRNLRLLGVTLLFTLVTFGVPFVASIILVVIAEDSFTERGWFFIGFTGFLIGLVLATLILCISDYAKVILFREDERNAFRAFGQAGRLVLGNFRATFGRYWLMMAIGSALFGVYFLIDSMIGMYNWPTIILMLLIQQAFIFSRIVLKTWNLGVVYDVYGRLPKPVVPVRSFVVPVVEGAKTDELVGAHPQPAIDQLTETLDSEKPAEAREEGKDHPLLPG